MDDDLRGVDPDALRELVEAVAAGGGSGAGSGGRAGAVGRPFVVAIDGRSGVGKSTLAAAAAARLGNCPVIEGDEFYAGGSAQEWDRRSPAENARCVLDRQGQHAVLDTLRRGESAQWFGYDWDAFDGRRLDRPSRVDPAAVVILEGVYSCRPELREVVDLRVLLRTPEAERLARLLAREGDLWADGWFDRWSAAEQYYFTEVVDQAGFDLVLQV